MIYKQPDVITILTKYFPDTEFVVRIINSGIKRKNVRFNAIQYHLWHNENSRLSLKRNDAILDNAIKKGIQWCENGINSIGKNES